MYDEIRKMSDTELKDYLRAYKSRICIKCGEEANYTLNIQSYRNRQQKKLCCLCDDCYDELINHLKVIDIEWDN